MANGPIVLDPAKIDALEKSGAISAATAAKVRAGQTPDYEGETPPNAAKAPVEKPPVAGVSAQQLGAGAFSGLPAGLATPVYGPKKTDASFYEPRKADAAPQGALGADYARPSAGGAAGGGGVSEPKDFDGLTASQRLKLMRNQAVEDYGKVQEHRDNVLTAMQGVASVEAQKADAIANHYGEVTNHLDNIDKERERHEMERQERVNQTYGEYKQAVDEYSKTNIDPNKVYNSMGTGEKVAAGIFMILGGIGAGLAKGPNQAVEAMNNAINRDIDAQKANLNKKGNAANMRQGLMKDMMGITNDERAAELLTRSTYLNKAALDLEAKAAQFKKPEIQANAAVGAEKLRQEAAAADMQFRERLNQLSLGSIPKPAGGGAGTKQDNEGAKYISEQEIKLGLPGLETSLDSVSKDLASGSGSRVYNIGKNFANQAGGLTGAVGNLALDAVSDDSTKNANLHMQDVLNQLLKMRSGAAVSEPEYNRYYSMLMSGDTKQVTEAVNQLRQQVVQTKASIRGGATPGGAAAYDQRSAAAAGNGQPQIVIRPNK